jgi:DNA-binding MarR family transcriptional regulator
MEKKSIEEITAQDSGFYARFLIGRLRHLMFNARQKELAPFRISPRQATILFILQNLGHKPTLAELAEHTDREINTLSLQMTRMEREGLVKKTRESPKSKLLRFELTEKGMESYKASHKSKSINVIMTALSEEERQQLIELLQKVIVKAEKY